MTRPTPERRDAYRVFRAMPTRWADNDPYGHMNNVVHYQLFDTAVNAFLIEAGLIDFVHGTTIGLVAETACAYFAEMAFPDMVHAGLRIGRMGNTSVTYEVGLFRNDDDQAAAQGRFVHVYVDRETRKPKQLDAAWRAKLEVLL